MANNPQRLVDRFMAMSASAHVQGSADVPLDIADLTARYRAEITMEEVVARNEVRDCRNEFLVDEKLRTRALRFTLTYTEVTPQLLAVWLAYFLGAQSGPTGTPANEVKTLTQSGTVSGGTFTLELALEGRTVETKPIPFDATPAQIASYLTAPHMLYIQPGDITVTGTWGAGMVITFVNTGRLGRANLPAFAVDNTLITGGGTVVSTETTPGAQNAFTVDMSTSRPKQRFSFVLGWENVTDRFEHYYGYAVESLNIVAERRQNVQLTVTIIGLWAPDIISVFSVPACTTVDALVTDDCRINIDSVWETTDINSLTVNLNDSVPVDESAAYGFDSVDIQTLERGDQPVYDINGSIFSSEVDNIYQVALNERTEDPVPVIIHYGMPGNRLTIEADDSKLKFGTNRFGTAGTLNKSVVNFQATPYRPTSSDKPVEGLAYLDQATAFLTASP